MKRLPLLALVAVLSSGCSLLLVDGPPQIRAGAPVPATADCTTGSTMPIVDIIIGVSTTMMVAEVVDPDDGWGSGEVLMFALPVGFFGSSFEGFRRTRRCREFLATPVAPDTATLAKAPVWPMSLGTPPMLPAPPIPPEPATRTKPRTRARAGSSGGG